MKSALAIGLWRIRSVPTAGKMFFDLLFHLLVPDYAIWLLLDLLIKK